MEYVQTEAGLRALVEATAGAGLIALDTEAAGYHRYLDRICLIQLSTRNRTFIVDPLAVAALQPLEAILVDASTEVVLHDADYDLRLLWRDHGLRIAKLFDTKIAAQFAGEPSIGLASLVEKHLDVRLDKRHQRADWAQRPLTADMLEYAAEDTRHLPALRDILYAELERLGRLSWAEEEFDLIVATQGDVTTEDREAFLRIKNARDLRPRQLAALRELHGWREDVARERDVAPFRVLSNEALTDLARRMPEQAGGLAGVGGLSPALAQRRGAEILAAVQRARAIPDDQLPVRPRGPRRPPPDPALEARVEQLKRARDDAADALGLDRGFLMPRQRLEALARSRPNNAGELQQVDGVRRWQVEALGTDLLKALRKG